jgi:hypothetical protein
VVGIRYWVLGSYWGFRFFSLQRSGIFVAIIGGLIFSAPAERYYFWSDYEGEGGVGSSRTVGKNFLVILVPSLRPLWLIK